MTITFNKADLLYIVYFAFMVTAYIRMSVLWITKTRDWTNQDLAQFLLAFYMLLGVVLMIVGTFFLKVLLGE